jgi:formylglycine-generating enzyme required for sulfatase activity
MGEGCARNCWKNLSIRANWFDRNKANTRETGIRQTTAVGIFPHGQSPYGVMDMSGNVWEWCLGHLSTIRSVTRGQRT